MPGIDPAAGQLLDFAIEAYRGAKGISLRAESQATAKQGNVTIHGALQWQSTAAFRKESIVGASKTVLLFSDGILHLSMTPSQIYRTAINHASPSSLALRAGDLGGGLASFLPALLSGDKNLALSENDARNGQLEVDVLPPTLIEGRLCHGVRRRAKVYNGKSYEWSEAIGWFDAQDSKLRRVQAIYLRPRGKSLERLVVVSRIMETNFNPQFTPATFAWSPPPGAKEIGVPTRPYADRFISPNPTTSQLVTEIEPPAIELFERAMGVYQRASSLRLRSEITVSGTVPKVETMTGTVLWQKPDLLRAEVDGGSPKNFVLCDGKTIYYSRTETSFQRQTLGGIPLIQFVRSGSLYDQTEWFWGLPPAFLPGLNSLRELLINNRSFFRIRVNLMPPTLIDGVLCDGMRVRLYPNSRHAADINEVTTWFDASQHTFKRQQQVSRIGSTHIIIRERVLETELNPTFTPDTFIWSPSSHMREVVGNPFKLRTGE
jgi:outer membrane lipoprotein-sorting protein